ncbi:nitrate reductase molybdenum cofactor assembly chaperone [Maricaulis sp.]|uniref:nitrate reductase molybdenum cofactor assembly chaperone n=1 Tax=Maricaulis sp. TaxID=1486257 RepID=UPI002B270934|nr:nitrate reductase molybdenum cofactor assembly chaperone [Maricaulis sp.]
MTLSFKVYAALLSYPTEDIRASASRFAGVLEEENLIAPEDRSGVGQLIDELGARDLFELQARYVDLFDRSRALSLHLFEHVHGESRDRGQAMVDLKALYESNGLEITASELPDFLPLFLEYLSQRPLDEARALLGETAHVLDALAERLGKRESVYQAVLLDLARIADRPAEVEKSVVETPAEDPQTLEAIDQAWEEEQVRFGPDPSAGCPVAENMLTKMAVPAAADSDEGRRP